MYADTDGDGVVMNLELQGCTDINASNYAPTASEDDKPYLPSMDARII